jgi:hypothetical protein
MKLSPFFDESWSEARMPEIGRSGHRGPFKCRRNQGNPALARINAALIAIG